MHTPAATFRATRLATIEFGDDLLGRHAFGQCVAVAAVSAKNYVVSPQMRTDAGRNCFLSNVRVACSVNQSLLARFGKLQFTFAYQLHGAIEVQQDAVVKLCRGNLRHYQDLS